VRPRGIAAVYRRDRFAITVTLNALLQRFQCQRSCNHLFVAPYINASRNLLAILTQTGTIRDFVIFGHFSHIDLDLALEEYDHRKQFI
jgi:hypothetical protein